MSGTGAKPKARIGWRAGAAALLAAAVLLATGCGSRDEASTTSVSSTSAETTTSTETTTTAAAPTAEDCGKIEIRFEDGTGDGQLTATGVDCAGGQEVIQGYFDALAPKLAGKKVPDPILVGDFVCPSGSGPVVCSSPEGAYSFQVPRGE